MSESSASTISPIPDRQGKPRQRGVFRRTFLGVIGAVAGGAVVSRYDLVLGLLSDGDEKSIEQATGFLKEVYGLDVLADGSPASPNFTGETLSKHEQRRGLELILEEIVKYPPSLFKENKINKVRILKNMKNSNGEKIGGYADVDGSGEFGISYDVGSFEMFRDHVRNHAREIFHHEVFHILDFKDGGYDRDDKFRFRTVV